MMAPNDARAPISHPSVWTGAEMTAKRGAWLLALGREEVAEIEAVVMPLAEAGTDPIELGRGDFPWPVLAPRLKDARREILHGRGFVQFRGLPVARLGRRGAALAFWGIGRHLGDEVASQNAAGHLLGHISDLGQSRANPASGAPIRPRPFPITSTARISPDFCACTPPNVAGKV